MRKYVEAKGTVELEVMKDEDGIHIYDESSSYPESFEEYLSTYVRERENLLNWHKADEGEKYYVIVKGEYVEETRTRHYPGYKGIDIAEIKYKKSIS